MMRFEQATIPLEPRTTTGCIDLALRFCGFHLPGMLGLWLLFAAPTSLAVYLSALLFETPLPVAAAIVFFVTAPFGVFLICGAGSVTFGEPWRLAKVWRRLLRDGRTALWRVFAMRFLIALASALCLLPGGLLAVHHGFTAEQLLLKRFHPHGHDRRIEVLVKLEFSDLFMRGLCLWGFGLGLWVLLFCTIDLLATVLFGAPIFMGRVPESEFVDTFSTAAMMVGSDPLVLAVLAATGLAAYLVGRLAWFFCFIDLRVRRDCWDLELEFRREAERLGGVS